MLYANDIVQSVSFLCQAKGEHSRGAFSCAREPMYPLTPMIGHDCVVENAPVTFELESACMPVVHVNHLQP